MAPFKTSFLDNEDPIKYKSYKGTRTYRGLFKTAAGLKINADSNGAMQIIKKHIQYSVQNINEIRICLQRPIRLNVSWIYNSIVLTVYKLSATAICINCNKRSILKSKYVI